MWWFPSSPPLAPHVWYHRIRNYRWISKQTALFKIDDGKMSCGQSQFLWSLSPMKKRNRGTNRKQPTRSLIELSKVTSKYLHCSTPPNVRWSSRSEWNNGLQGPDPSYIMLRAKTGLSLCHLLQRRILMTWWLTTSIADGEFAYSPEVCINSNLTTCCHFPNNLPKEWHCPQLPVFQFNWSLTSW